MSDGISLAHALFRQAIAKHLGSIGRLTKKYGVPMTRHTLILRDPANDDLSLCMTNEDDVEEAFRVTRRLEGKDGG